jgi:hypothetical protein
MYQVRVIYTNGTELLDIAADDCYGAMIETAALLRRKARRYGPKTIIGLEIVKRPDAPTIG